MLLSWIPAVIFFILMGFLYFFARRVYRIIHRVLLIIFILNIILIITVYLDSQEIQQKLPIEDKLFALMDKQEILSAFRASTYVPEPITDIRALQSDYSQGGIESLQKEYFKVMLFNISIFDDIDHVLLSDTRLEAGLAKSIVTAPDSLDQLTAAYASALREKGAINTTGTVKLTGIEQDQQARVVLFSAALNRALAQKGLVGLLRSGELQVHPETITFKFIRLLPESVLDSVVNEEEVNLLGTSR